MAVLKNMVVFLHQLIAVEGTKTPAGEARQTRPHRTRSVEEARRSP